MSDAVEHYCSSTLIVLGDFVSLAEISAQLGVSPGQSWRKGDRKSFQRPDGSLKIFDSIHEQSGWKRFISAELQDQPLDEQLRYWDQFIGEREAPLTMLNERGMELILDLYVGSGEVGSLSPGFLGLLGLRHRHRMDV